jgi:ligand-binding sensor domain-containing protein
MLKKIHTFVFLCAVVLGNNLQSQTWTSWYGNGSIAITAAATDSSGNLWFATMGNGLLVKNGSTWTNYNQYNSQLASNYVKSVAVAPDGTIWAATESGLCHTKGNGWEVFTDKNSSFEDIEVEKVAIGKNGEIWAIQWPGVHRYKNGTWTKFTESNSAGFYNDYPITLGVDNNGVCWAAGYGYEMWSFDGSKWSTRKDLGLDTVEYVEIYAIAFDKQNNQFVGTQNHGVYAIKSDTTLQYLGGDMGFYINQVNDLMLANDGKMWIAGEGGGIAIYDGVAFTNQTPNEGLGSDRVSSLTGRNGMIAAVNSEAGVSIFNTGTWTFYDPDKIGVFSTSGIYSMTVDKSSNLWVGGNAEIAKYDGSAWKVYRSTGTGIPNEVVTSIDFDSKNKMWIATYRGLAEFDQSANTWNNYDMATAGFPSDYISDMAITSKDIVWLATDSGLVKFDGMTATTYNKASGKLVVNEVSCVFVDKNDVVWAGTWGGGLVKYDGSNWTKILASTANWASDYITSINADNNGNLWVGTFGGYAVFDGSNWTAVASTVLPNKAEYLVDISFDLNNDPWIATDQGVVHRTPTGDVLYSAPSKPLADNLVYQTLNVGKDIWFAANMVLSRFADAVTLRPSSTSDLAMNQLRISPNPVKSGSDLLVTLDELALKNLTTQEVSILDNQGRLVKKVKLSGNENTTGESIRISTDYMAPGCYTLSMEGVSTGYKFLVIR